MATKTITNHVCDISGDPATYPAVKFSLDNVDYEIDLSEEHREGLTYALDPFIAHARRIGGRRKTPTASNGNGQALTASTKTTIDENRVKRAWLREHGWPDLADRGRIPADAQEAYVKAMSETKAEPKTGKAAPRRKRTPAKTAA